MGVIKIKDRLDLKEQAANWFHEKWGIPVEAYRGSMEECISGRNPVPQWYVVLDKDEIIAGLGVIENDFHDRKDLTPDICALYVDVKYRGRGIAGDMLRFVCRDMSSQGLNTLYLITDHTSFYEKYGWEFLCMVQGDGEPEKTRMYIHREQDGTVN